MEYTYINQKGTEMIRLYEIASSNDALLTPPKLRLDGVCVRY